ncbi:hypothetical protein [Nesterenkonia natronophila]|uniref:DUF3558 domain-containing protein n=1 Tax=Nesterenkonia natronophila TaxID=2174932 RepID=A0A3A4F1L1_9MICC|nr:hypothetical protein [Nesterenkonia natronophila]RJN31611.1 hypothetical protein D3250_05520 [Nesterenkonia natronophila]
MSYRALLLATLALASCGDPVASDDNDPPSPTAAPETSALPPTAEDTETGADSPASDEPTEEEGEPPDEEDPEAAEEELSIPQEWITLTSEAWPESQGFGQHAPVQEFTDECLLFAQEPEFFGEVTQFRFSGFGSYGRPTTTYGNEPATEDSYRYLCSLGRAEDQRAAERPVWAPEAQLMVTESVEHAEETVAAFLEQTDLPEQVQEVQTIQVHGTEIHTVEREFPNNPGNGGELGAIYYDEDAGAILKLRMHSMDEELRAEHGRQGIAEDLVRLLLESR